MFHGDYCAQLLMLGPSSACPVQQAGYVSFYFPPPPSPAQYPIGMRTQLGTFWRCSGPTCGASAVRSTCSGGTTRGPQPPRMGPLWAPLLPPHRLEVGSSLQQALCRCGRTGVELRAGGRVGRFEVVVVAHHMVAQPAQAHVLTPDAAAPAPQPPSPPHATCIPHNHSIHCGVCVCVCVCARNTRDPWDGGLAPPPPPSRPPPSPLPGPVTTQAHDAVPVPAVMARSCWVAVLRTRLLVTTLWKPGGWWLGSVAEPVCLKRCRPVGSNWNPWCFVDAER